MKQIDYAKNPLVRKFIELESSENKSKNIFLYAGGGYGKTTAMLCLFKYLLDKAANGEKIVPIYIDVKKLNFNEPNPIISYIHSKYSGSDTQESDVKNLFSDQAPEFSTKYTYYILIDGLNETNDDNKGNLIDIIFDKAQISNVRFIVSSRIKETFDKASFCALELQKLDEKQIKDYLDKNFGKKYNEQTKVKEINKSFIEILQIPMFMKVFSKTYDKRNPYPDIYDEKTVRKADILDSYIQKILIELKERTNSYDNNLLKFVINFYLPALAFQMAEENVLSIDSEIVDKKLCLNYFVTFFRGTRKKKVELLIKSDRYTPEIICSENFALINDNDGNYSFIHQIWRDFFAAKHIINCMNSEKFDDLETSVDESVRQFVGELVREYVDEYKYSRKPAYKLAYENGKVKVIDNPDPRRCECDFEEKDNLETWSESPIEHFMQQHNMNSVKSISSIVTRNLIEIMKTCRKNHITADYSNLNLFLTTFELTNISCSEFFNCVFDNTSFKAHAYLFRKTESFSYFNQKYAVSPSGRYYVRVFYHNFIVFDAKTNKEYIKSNFAVIGDIQIQQIAFIEDNKLIVRYPYCLAIFNIDNKQLKIDDVYYFTNNSFYKFEDFINGRIKLSSCVPYIPYTITNCSEEFVLKLLENESENNIEKVLELYKVYEHEFKHEIDFNSLLDFSQKLLEIIPMEKYLKIYQTFLYGIVKEEVVNIDILDDRMQFLRFEGMPLENFTIDRKNDIIYILCSGNIYKYNCFNNKSWTKVADNRSNGQILFVPKFGMLSIPKFGPFDYVIDFIDVNNKHISNCIYKMMRDIYNDEYNPIIDNISICENDSILRIEFSRVNVDNYKQHYYIYYNFKRGNIESINDKIRNNKYYEIVKLNYINSNPLCYELFENKFSLIENQEPYYKEIKLIKIENQKRSETLLYKCFELKSMQAKRFNENYIFFYVPDSAYNWYYDINKKRFYTLSKEEKEIKINNANNEKITLPNLARSITIESSKKHYDDLSEKCKNTDLGVEWIVYSREKNICDYLIKHNQKNISLSFMNSGCFTYFYDDYNGLHVNLMQSASDGRKRIILKTFKEDFYVYNNYLIVFYKESGKIRIYNINFGYFIGEYELLKLLSKAEIDKLKKGFNFFAKENMKVHITDKCYISINKRMIILDKNSDDFISVPEIDMCFRKLKNTREYVTKENILFGLNSEQKLFYFCFEKENSRSSEIDAKKYQMIYDCEGSFFFTLDVYNEFSIWDYSTFDINNVNEFSPLVTISFDYLTLFNVDKAKFDDCDLNDYQKNQLKLIGADFQ